MSRHLTYFLLLTASLLSACDNGSSSRVTTQSGSSTSTSSSSSTSTSSSSSGVISSSIPVRFNEAVSSNSTHEDEEGDTPDWIELYNTTDNPITLSGWTLSDDPNGTDQWTIPEITILASQALTFWASGKDSNTEGSTLTQPHTNFKISSKGETLFLHDDSGQLIDSLEVANIPNGVSIGRSLKSNTTAYFSTPTPGNTNSTDEFEGVVQSQIVFSDEGGTTTATQLALSGAETLQTIRYTLDARIPTASSPIYSSAIALSSNTVVRARIFQNGYIPSPIQNRTLIIDTQHELPVTTLITEPNNFFSESTGIYSFGSSYEPDFPYFGANFWEDKETDIHFSFYEPSGNLGVEFNAGIKIFGGWSRANPQRSMSIFARGKYGTPEIEYPLFPTSYDTFQALVLRNSGNDWMRTMLKDIALTSLMDGSGLDTQSYRPTAVYLNSNYWGLYNLREKVNEHFIASRHDIKAKNIDLLESSGTAIEGSSEEYQTLIDFISNNNLANNANYQQVAEQIDIDNFIIYQIAQIYFNNTDWPGNNIKYWKSPETKWRWILYDTDFGFGIWSTDAYLNNTLSFALAEYSNHYANAPWATLLLRKLMANTSFKNQFISQFADELNSRFLPGRVAAHIDSLTDVISSEMDKHTERWKEGLPTKEDDSYIVWSEEIENMKTFGNNRPEPMRLYIQEQFNLANSHTLTIESDTPNQGQVHLNSLSITEQTWSGIYFEGVPVTLTAEAADGYVFSNWTGSVESEQETIELNLSESQTLKAVFTAL